MEPQDAAQLDEPVPAASWMGPELRELQTSCDRGEISENEREKDARVLADLWACELEDQRVRAEGYVWNEELGSISTQTTCTRPSRKKTSRIRLSSSKASA
jgi:hypothetical protein